ncbi:MAG: enolase C-terminal domain-like protein, partial [Bacteroidia bacterium]
SRSTSCTIGIGSEAETIQKLKEAEAFSFLKIKAGTADDKALIQNIRKHTDKPLYVDVNQGWRDKHKALELLYFFKEQNVVFVEQPLPVHLHEDMAWLTAGSPLPTIADESVKRLADLNQISDCFSGINIKLMKCTGTYEALKMIRYAKQKQLKVMIGCMAESSCATTAMAQLMQSGDYVDLDAPTLLKNDPFKGVTYENGKVVLNDSPGFGMEPLIGF